MSTAEVLVKALGGSRGMARCPAHKDRTPSLSVNQGRDGRTLVRCFAGCSQEDVITALDRLGLWHPNHRNVPTRPPRSKTDEPPREVHQELSDYGRQLWRECRPITLDDAPGQYLANRGCRIPPPHGDLRWHPTLKHPSGYRGPALVGLITNAETNAPLSLHRTWIRADGTKADIEYPRLLLANHSKQGGVIRIWPDDWVTYGLAIAEGIETALTLARAFTPVWSLIDAGNLAKFPVLPVIEALTVAVDFDDAGCGAGEAVARRWYDAGREVRLIQSPNRGEDLNDWAGALDR